MSSHLLQMTSSCALVEIGGGTLQVSAKLPGEMELLPAEDGEILHTLWMLKVDPCESCGEKPEGGFVSSG